MTKIFTNNLKKIFPWGLFFINGIGITMESTNKNFVNQNLKADNFDDDDSFVLIEKTQQDPQGKIKNSWDDVVLVQSFQLQESSSKLKENMIPTVDLKKFESKATEKSKIQLEESKIQSEEEDRYKRNLGSQTVDLKKFESKTTEKCKEKWEEEENKKQEERLNAFIEEFNKKEEEREKKEKERLKALMEELKKKEEEDRYKRNLGSETFDLKKSEPKVTEKSKIKLEEEEKKQEEEKDKQQEEIKKWREREQKKIEKREEEKKKKQEEKEKQQEELNKKQKELDKKIAEEDQKEKEQDHPKVQLFLTKIIGFVSENQDQLEVHKKDKWFQLSITKNDQKMIIEIWDQFTGDFKPFMEKKSTRTIKEKKLINMEEQYHFKLRINAFSEWIMAEIWKYKISYPLINQTTMINLSEPIIKVEIKKNIEFKDLWDSIIDIE
jgi:hypothetical protein